MSHRAYVNNLPSSETLLTPLYFNEDEKELFRHTNLYVAAQRQEALWKAEWEDICRTVPSAIAEQLQWWVKVISLSHGRLL